MEELLEELGNYENVVLHYRCSHCGDEQVTYTMKTDEVREQLSEDGEIFIGLPCENCGTKETYVKLGDITFYENMDIYN